MTGYPTDQSAHSHNDDNEDDEHEDDGAAAAAASTAGLTLFSLVYLGSMLLTVCDRPLSAAFQHSFFFNLPRSSYLSLIPFLPLPLLAGSLVLLPNTRRQSAIRQQSRRAISCATIAASTAAA